MENIVLIILTLFLLIAYTFDLISSKTKLPSVIVLLFLGWLIRQILLMTDFEVQNLKPLLPALGTLALILIVLEGSLDLKINESKIKFIIKSFISALLPIIFLSFLISILFSIIFKTDFNTSLINAIPFSVISSSIAIPSASSLPGILREFVIYETSASDVFGIIIFNFAETISGGFGVETLFKIVFQLLFMILSSLIFTFVLMILLNRVTHKVKFIPIILTIVLIYSISKAFHLPALIFILIFGLSMSNINEIEEIIGLKSLRFEDIEGEIERFHDIVAELTFLTRSFFFFIFGYTLETEKLAEINYVLISFGIVILIYATRYIQLKLMKLPVIPFLFMVPRGLITILLFLSIAPEHSIPLVSESVITMVIIFTNIIMVAGLIKNRKNIEGVSLEGS